MATRTRDLLEMEAGSSLKTLFVIINLLLATITILALLAPVWIMGYKDSPYWHYFVSNQKWHWEPPTETQIMLLVFAIYMHVWDLPVTFLRLFKAMFNCCGCGGCLALPYAWTHILTPGMYIAALVIAMEDDWGHNYWTKAMKDKHGIYYPYYIGGALAAQIILRIFLFAKMQSASNPAAAEETQPLVDRVVPDVENAANKVYPPLTRPDKQKAGCCR